MSTSEPLVSVVVPVYNGARFLRDCLGSVLEQSYSNWELVVVDNASTDETPAIIREVASADERVRVFRNPTTVGALRNHNIAVRKVAEASVYLKILHADDKLLPTCLERMVQVGDAHPSVGMIGAYAHGRTRIICRGLPEGVEYFEGPDACRRTLLRQAYPFWSPSCLMHRTQAVLERETFYHESNLHADLEATYQILSKWDFGFVHEPLTVIGVHKGSRTSTLAHPMRTLTASNFELLTTYGPRFLEPEEYQRQVAYRLKRYHQMLARSALEWRGPAFWRYHREALRRAGHKISARSLLSAIARELSQSPRASIRRLTSGLTKRQHAKA